MDATADLDPIRKLGSGMNGALSAGPTTPATCLVQTSCLQLATVVGSIIRFTSVIFEAGKPLISA